MPSSDRASRLTVNGLFRQLARLIRNDQLGFTALALVTGIVAGYAALAFRLAIELFQFGALGFLGEYVHAGAANLAWYHVVLAPALGGLAIGIFMDHVMPGGRSTGVADVIQAATFSTGRISLREGFRGAVINAATLGVGGSAGREGPVVHLAGTLAHWIAERLHLGPTFALTLLGCAVASGVSASFNAPIAGVFFAIEVVIRSYAVRTFVPVVVASVAGTVVSRIHIGKFPAFNMPTYEIMSYWEFPAFALLGVVSALVAILFMWSVITANDIANRMRIPNWMKPAAGGLVVGIVATAFPQILGVGYDTTDAALRTHLPLLLMIALVIVKTFATAVTLGSRLGGGVFSPAIYLGAMTGGAFGIIAGWALPGLASSPGLYAVIGMGAVAGAVLGAPVSSILIVAELTGDYEITIALMLAVSIASLINNEATGQSFFQWQLARQGVHVRGGRTQRLLQATRIRDLMSDRFHIVSRNATIAVIRRLFQQTAYEDYFVTDDDGRLAGTLYFPDLRDVAFDPELNELINAGDAARPVELVLARNDSLNEAVRVLDSAQTETIPVVDDLISMKVEGIVSQADILRAYNRALVEGRAEERGED